jgi:hypothetical protein
MAFVIEDGTGLPNANTYATVAMYRAYHTERGRDVSSQLDAAVQGYLVRATDFVEKTFATQWKGTRETMVQALAHPREGIVVDGVTLPTSLVHAATIGAGGTGYVVGDIVTLVGGTADTVATFRVDTAPGGVVSAVSPIQRGDYDVLPTMPAATTGGTGAGLTLNVTFGGPVNLVQAIIEYALRASKYDELAPDSPVPFERTDPSGNQVPAGGFVTGKAERVGPISEEVTFADPTTVSSSGSMPRYPAADALLKPLLLGGGSGRVIRN